MSFDFSSISEEYEKFFFIQKRAGYELLELLDIKEDYDVLDVGCGTGYFTKEIRKLTAGKVIGIDPSTEMLSKAYKNCKDLNIIFHRKSAEEIDYINCFDVIFCNSAFQWFKDPKKAVKNFFKALKKGGRVGIQSPATQNYSPNFIKAIEKVKEDPKLNKIFSRFKNPWFFLESEEEYKALFVEAGFKVAFCEIRKTISKHTPEELFNIFKTGAIAGYLNKQFYEVKINNEYTKLFLEKIKESFEEQKNTDNYVTLQFKRIFLLAIKL